MARDSEKSVLKSSTDKVRSPYRNTPQTPVIGPSTPQMMAQNESKSSSKALSVMSSPNMTGKVSTSNHNF